MRKLTPGIAEKGTLVYMVPKNISQYGLVATNNQNHGFIVKLKENDSKITQEKQ
jgi:hypothetical protein